MNFQLPPIKQLKGEVPNLTPDEYKEYDKLAKFLEKKKAEWGESYPILVENLPEYHQFVPLFNKLQAYANFKIDLLNQIENN